MWALEEKYSQKNVLKLVEVTVLNLNFWMYALIKPKKASDPTSHSRRFRSA